MLELRVKFINSDETKFCEFITDDFIVPHVGEKILIIDISNMRIEGRVDKIKHSINIPLSYHLIIISIYDNCGD